MFERGSEWRKWDLQVHTPYSFLNNQFGNNWDKYIIEFFHKAIDDGISVIGVTDYYSINGYEKIKTYLNDESKLKFLFEKDLKTDKLYLDKIKQIKVLPCIEFRFKDVVVNKGRDNKIEANFILSDEIEIEDIKNKFLSKISFTDLNNTSQSLTDHNIKTFGASIQKVQSEFVHKSDYVAGLECLIIDFLKTVEILKNDPFFKDKYIILLPEDDITDIDWASSSHMTRKKYYIEAHGLFSINSNSINWGLEEKTKQEFGSYMPCFSCSDCHKFDEMFKYKSGKICWIKADPTFTGLKQVFCQPTERLFLGDEPTKITKVNNLKYYYIDRLLITKNIKSKNTDNWFDADIPLNTGLITIIGNKGTGKSALADILGYMTESQNIDKASFLTNERFRKEDKNYADNYQAKLYWKGGKVVEKNSLNDKILDVQSAEYLPQKYIEELCNELNDKFQKEIDKVIFSYIDIADKNECTNLSELIAKKTTDLDYKIKKYRGDIENINQKIIALEDRNTEKYKEEITQKLNQKEKLLESNKNNKPKPIKKPIDLLASDSIDKINKKIEEIDKLISIKQSEKLKINILIDKTKQFLEKFRFAEEEVKNLVEEANILSKELDIDKEISLEVKSNMHLLENKLNALKKQKNALDIVLNDNKTVEIDDTHQLLYVKRRNMIDEREKILVTAQESEVKYQKYLKNLKQWENENKKLQGETCNDEDSILYYQNELNYLNEKLFDDLEALEEERLNIVENIFGIYVQKMEVYRTLYAPVEEKLKNILNNNSDKIEFETVITINNNFKNEFMSYVRQNVDSSYKGKLEGIEYLNAAIREVDFNTFTGLKQFVQKIQHSISGNKDKIRKLVPNTLACYNLLNKLDYLNISFTLKMDGRTLNELSPGQRGNVLLIFYLALSKNSEPIIIDQPEDNLDNQSVFDKLVPCILEAKKNRQVIIVTHNPNIAIACDAEQIICSNIDKTQNKITYISGSIENEIIRKNVIDILEGTMPAFTLRRLKYFE